MIGQELSQFEITDKLREGGLGTVYRVRDSKLGRKGTIADVGSALNWSMHPDRRRIAYVDVVGKQASNRTGRRLHLIFNVFDELERIAPTVIR